jgi:hypothetical protein
MGFDAQMIFDHRGTALPVTYTFPNQQAYLDAKSGVNPKGYTTFTQTIGTPDFDMDNSLASWFVQDDFKIKPNFKILYGVRHDMYLYTHGIEGSPVLADVQSRHEQPRAAGRLRVDAQSQDRSSAAAAASTTTSRCSPSSRARTRARVWPPEPRASTSRRQVRSRPRSPAT